MNGVQLQHYKRQLELHGFITDDFMKNFHSSHFQNTLDFCLLLKIYIKNTLALYTMLAFYILMATYVQSYPVVQVS